MTHDLPPELRSALERIGERRPERVAAIHATVDLERRIAELAWPADAVDGAVDDTLLGARVVVIEGDGSPAIALAEPTTEGRLAAALARHGEGQVGEYISLPAVGPLDEVRFRAREAGLLVSSPGSGPFGPGVVVLGRPIGGYQVIVVERRSLPSAG